MKILSAGIFMEPAGITHYSEKEIEVEYLVADEIRYRNVAIRTVEDIKKVTMETLNIYKELLCEKDADSLGYILYSEDVSKIEKYLSKINLESRDKVVDTLFDSRGTKIITK
ncbi:MULTISPECIES: hypothetical protein [unclassified Enterococcus]|uniref:hypothetical protein n=1 Tax=unclassified Enterococcus TaxID=2608891 RepID=UPI001CE1E82D|nr:MULTISPECIES: hypothetical protein [unclassified Enterococcus]MCA5014579.1 hypothetical protein [Enterococcus sp. S23]MCA5017832.1 hypothetical protein [Enterococcus sp. S22(2020)]